MNLPRVFSDYLSFELWSWLHKAFTVLASPGLWVACIFWHRKLALMNGEYFCWCTKLCPYAASMFVQSHFPGWEIAIGVSNSTRVIAALLSADLYTGTNETSGGVFSRFAFSSDKGYSSLCVFAFPLILYCIYFYVVSVSFFFIILKGTYFNTWI